MENFNYDLAITHSTIFHSDDVFGAALCKLLNPDIRIIRTLDVDKYLEMAESLGEKAIVFDIGLGKYDHHQADKALRPDGTPYCGFGLLWRDFGHILCPEQEAWEKVDQNFVLAIDKADNGVAQNLLSSALKAMNPNWNEETSEDSAFRRALNVAEILLQAQIDHANAAAAAREEVLLSYTGGEILVLDQYLPYSDIVQTDERLKDVLFVVYPSHRGGWNVQTITKQPGTFINRMDFPKEWLGHADPERGIHFAHTANFLIACDTKEQAIKVAEEAVEAGKVYATVAYSV
jgi:uncharacterized UPF0160 family protein